MSLMDTPEIETPVAKPPARRPERTEVVEPDDVVPGTPEELESRGRRALARPVPSSGTGISL